MEKVPATTTFGELRECGNVAEQDYMAQWRPQAHAEGLAGHGENGQAVKQDYFEACRGQNGIPLLTCFPDSVRLLVVCVIEPLHTCINVLNHLLTYLFIKAHVWGGKKWRSGPTGH